MTFEDRLRSGLSLAVRIAPGEVSDLGDIVDRAKRRRNKKRIVGVVSVFAVTVAMAAPQLFGFTTGSEDVSVSVAGREMAYSEILNDNPVVVRGVEAEAPRFDTSHLGEEVPVVASALPEEIPDLVSGGGVFAGTVEGVPIFVYGDRAGNEDVFCVTTGGDSLCTDAAAPGGGASLSCAFGLEGDVVCGIVVGDLPSEVSVVAYSYADTGEVIGWQTPVAYASYMPFARFKDESRLTSEDEININWDFYDADGQHIGTSGIHP